MNGEAQARLRVVSPDEAPSFEELYDRYARRVATIGFRIMGRTNEVEDFVQDVFIEVIGALPRLQDPGAAKFWIDRIAVRTAMRRVRSARFRRWLGYEDVTQLEVEAPGMSAEDAVLLGEALRRLDGLSARARACWVLRVVEGYELAKVAEAVGCSLATAKRDITHAARVLAPTEASR